MANQLFAADFEPRPYWRDGAAPWPDEALPARADVVVIGAGYTGLSTALETARGGLATVVLEAGEPGEGCSTRNGGQISTSVKPSLGALEANYGDAKARAMRREGENALDWVENFVAREGIDCGFRRNGRFLGAHDRRAFDDLARASEERVRREGSPIDIVPKHEQRREIGSDFYHGGVVYRHFASIDAGRWHDGLMARASAAGAAIVARCRASKIEGKRGAFRIETDQGSIEASELAIATNGYGGALWPFQERRALPIGSYVMATEELGADEVAALFPTGRVICDTRRVVYYFGPSPSGTRVLFGGRVSAGDADPRRAAATLRADLAAIFPELETVRVARAWRGFVAYTPDELPRCGVHEGVHYAFGYCGSGVSMAPYLGMRMGKKILGDGDGATAFDDLAAPTWPLGAWTRFALPAAVAWRRARDRIDRAFVSLGA